MRRTVIAVLMLAIAATAGPLGAAEKTKKAAPAKGPRHPAMERLTCRTGPRDEQARLTVQMVKGRPMEFAYYSRMGTNVCSIHGKRGDAYTKWVDGDGKSTVRLIEGTATMEYLPGNLKLVFANVRRMTYCGMDGALNAIVEVSSKKADCALQRVFVIDDETDGVPETAGPTLR